MCDYSKNHYAIVNKLLSGSVILYTETELFQEISEKFDFYYTFFEKSFKYKLIKKPEIIYISSSENLRENNDQFSEYFTVILAVLSYEYSVSNRDFFTESLEHSFNFEEVKNLLNKSIILKHTKNINNYYLLTEKIEILFKEASERQIIHFDNQKEFFTFTSGVEVFFDYVKNIFNELN
jgi:hypothetical protein